MDFFEAREPDREAIAREYRRWVRSQERRREWVELGLTVAAFGAVFGFAALCMWVARHG